MSLRQICIHTLIASVINFAAAWTAENCPCPDKIQADLPNEHPWVSNYLFDIAELDPYDDSESCHIASMEHVHSALLHCPLITTLDLSVSMKGCTGFPDRYSLPFDLAGGEKLPALESLSLSGYDFDYSEWDRVKRPGEFSDPKLEDIQSTWLEPWYLWFRTGKASDWFRWRNLPQEQLRKRNLDLWLDAMDFSKLRYLSLGEGDDKGMTRGDALIERLPVMLPNLEELRIKGSWTDEDDEMEGHSHHEGDEQSISPAAEFVSRIPSGSLKTLSWTSADTCDEESFAKIVQHHGPHLTSLEWTTPEYGNDPRPTFTAQQLQRLGTLAPKIESLTIDLNRRWVEDGHSTWPLEELATIAGSLPNLRNLTIHFDMASQCHLALSKAPFDFHDDTCHPGCSEMNKFAHPLLNSTQSEILFQHIDKHKAGAGPISVTLRSGIHREITMDMVTTRDGWFEHKRAWAECSVLRQDGNRKEEAEPLCVGQDATMSDFDKWEDERCKRRVFGASQNPRWMGYEFWRHWDVYDPVHVSRVVGYTDLLQSWSL